MKIKPTKYAHAVFIISICYHTNKKYTFNKDADIIENRKLTPRSFKVSKARQHYSLYHNVDFEYINPPYEPTNIYYSIFIK